MARWRSGVGGQAVNRVSLSLLIVAVLACSAVVRGQSAAVWEYKPYEVRLALLTGASGELTPAWRRDALDRVARRVETEIGAFWRYDELPLEHSARQTVLARLDTLRWDDLPEPLRNATADKLLLLAVERVEHGWRVRGCDVDQRTRTISLPVEQLVAQGARLDEALWETLLAAFAPLTIVEHVDAEEVRLRVRAALLQEADHPLLLRPLDTLQPLVRYDDREGRPRHISTIDWTLLQVNEVRGNIAHAKLYSGFQRPLGGRRRGRVETLALRVQGSQRATRLKIISRSEPKRPLSGYDVLAYAPPNKTTRVVGRSDQRGEVLLPSADATLQILIVQHGEERLARVPLVTGRASTAVVEVANDDLRLEVEGLMTGVQEQVVDHVAQRQLALARARKQLDDGELDGAQGVLDQLRRNELSDPLGRQLRDYQQRLKSPDPQVQAKLQRLFDDTQQAVSRFLDPREINDLDREIKDARQRATKAASKS